MGGTLLRLVLHTEHWQPQHRMQLNVYEEPTKKELGMAIKNLASVKASGNDEISSGLLKQNKSSPVNMRLAKQQKKSTRVSGIRQTI